MEHLEKAIFENDKDCFENCIVQIHQFGQQKVAEMFRKRHGETEAVHHAAASGSTEMVKTLVGTLRAGEFNYVLLITSS